jgi:hypothetical protein
MRISDCLAIAIFATAPSITLHCQQRSSPVALQSPTPLKFESGNNLLIDTIPKANASNIFFDDEQFMCLPISEDVCQGEYVSKNVVIPATKRTPLLTVTGNILYDVNYRSRIDTPYAENKIYQHTLQTRLDFLYKGKYPFRVYLTSHFSNSPLLRRYTDLNFQYTHADFAKLLKKQLIEYAETLMASKIRELDSLKRVIDSKKYLISSLTKSIQKPDVTQRLVEERERNLFANRANELAPNASGHSSFIQQTSRLSNEEKKIDSAAVKIASFRDSLDDKKRMLDSLRGDLNQLETIYEKAKSLQQVNHDKLRKEIEGLTDINSLNKKIGELKVPDTLLPKGYKILYSIQSFNVGRSWVDYSELTVKNISITGLQVEYNPHYYYAFAAGKVDYRFRDYIVPNRLHSDQYVALARFGKGMRNGNHIIFTYYTGKRQFFNASMFPQSSGAVPSYNLAGVSIEGFYKINDHISLTVEVAKSTIPYYSLDSLQKRSWMNSVTRFKDRNNEAYSAVLHSYFPKTQTRFSGNLRYMGANFQSFSTFTTGASQLRWLARVEQPFFKKKLTVISSLQQNDYSNPFVTTTYKSSSILESFQANLTLRKWPFLSVGYYPSYQLTKMNDNKFSETRYYTLIANSGYYYHIHSVQLSTVFIFSKFYNAANDSGFVYFNSKNFLLSQGAAINRFSTQLNASVSVNTGYNIYTLENNGQLAITRLLSIGAGLKMIEHSLVRLVQWGYSGNIRVSIRKLGDIQVMMDKGFIPSFDRKLVENRYGRLTYFKTF